MCGIFAYINYQVPRDRRYILETLVNGLKRLEYRGYDSAGIAVDSGNSKDDTSIELFKQRGKVKALEDKIFENDSMDLEYKLAVHAGIAHTRWATHGVPNAINSHPHRSDDNNEFVVVHNGICTNYKTIKTFLRSHNYEFESDTDTEVIAKLIKYLWDNRENEDISFITLVERVIQQLEGAFALVFKSRHFPGQCVTTRRGSPLVIGIRSKSKLSTDNIPVLYSSSKKPLPRLYSTTELVPQCDTEGIEFYFASDASAIIEHTKQVIFLYVFAGINVALCSWKNSF